MDEGESDAILTPEVLRLIGTPEEMAREMERLRRDLDWIEVERDKLLAEYDGRWIAVNDGVVRASAEDLAGLFELVDTQGLPRQDVTVRYITSDEPILILADC